MEDSISALSLLHVAWKQLHERSLLTIQLLWYYVHAHRMTLGKQYASRQIYNLCKTALRLLLSQSVLLITSALELRGGHAFIMNDIPLS